MTDWADTEHTLFIGELYLNKVFAGVSTSIVAITRALIEDLHIYIR